MADDAFLNMMAGQSPGMFRGGGMAPSNGLFNMQTSNPLVGMLMNTVTGPIMQQYGPKAGLVPGQFLPTQNMADQRQASNYAANQQKIMSHLSQLDRPATKQFIQGVHRFAFNQEMKDEDAEKMSGDMAGLMPMLASLVGDEMFDEMSGKSGSAMIMGKSLHRAGFHTTDSATGRTGQSADTINALGEEIFANQFGTPEARRRMRGLKAGGAGALFEEMSRRGLTGGSIGDQSIEERVRLLASQPELTDEQIQRIAKRSGKTTEDVKADQAEIKRQATSGKPLDMAKIEQLGTMGEQLRTFDAKRAGRKLEDMSGAISAMKDIFGDMGHPNAPMQMLVAGLEALTQGGLTHLKPADAERMVRNTYNVAKRAGISMEAMAGMTAMQAQMADRLGLDRSVVPGLVKGSMAFGAAAGQTAGLHVAVYGNSSKEELTAGDQELRTQAAASARANRWSALARLGDAGLLKEGSKAAEMYEKVKNGDFADLPSVGSDKEMWQIMGEGGVDAATARESILSKHANQEQTGKYDIATLARGQQWAGDVKKLFESGVGISAMGDTDPKMDGNVKLANAKRIGTKVLDALHNAPVVDRKTDPAKIVEDVIRQDPAFANKTEKEIKLAAFNALSRLDRDAVSQGYRSRDKMLDKYDETTLKRGKKIEEEAATRAEIQTRMAGVGRAGVIERTMDAIRNFKPTDDNQDILNAALEIGGATTVGEMIESGDDVTRTMFKQAVIRKNAKPDSEEYKNADEIIEALDSGGDKAEKLYNKKKSKLRQELGLGKDAGFSQIKTAIETDKKHGWSDKEKDEKISEMLAFEHVNEDGGRPDVKTAVEETIAPTGKDKGKDGKDKSTLEGAYSQTDSIQPAPGQSTASTERSRPSQVTGTLTLKGLDTVVADLQMIDSGIMSVEGVSTVTSNIG